MGWARLDDRWHDHPKTIAAGMEASGLFVMCLTWAHQARRTSPCPGVIPEAVLSRLAGTKAKKLTKVLHDVGFFDNRTPAGWPIHDFDEYLPKYDPEQARAAGSRGGQARAAKQTASEPLSEPLENPQAVPVADAKQTSSTRASVRRNPVPVPQTLPPTAGGEPPAPETVGQRGNRLAKAYTDVVKLSNFPAVAGVVRKAINAGHPDDAITAALGRLAADGRSVTTDTLRVELEGLPPSRFTRPEPQAPGFWEAS